MDNKSELSMQVIINITTDGKLSINGFPNNITHAQQIIHSASDAITAYFIANAKAGKLDDKGNVVESKIVKPNGPITLPTGIPFIGNKDGK